MLRSVDEVQVGQMVRLHPHTKTASRACHEQQAVKIMKDPKAHWPMVMVTWEQDGADRWELVHSDNIKPKLGALTTKVEKKEGDTNQDSKTSSKWARVRKMPGKVVEVNLAPDEEQGTLF